MNKKLYITSTLPYPNSIEGAHVGHLFEFVITDAISRYFKNKLGEENVFFNTGIDEEGLKIWQKSIELNISVEAFLEQQTIIWKGFCETLQIEYDNFYKTSSKEHQRNVQKFWSECIDRGDIYKKKYSGKYCVGCESFKLEKELEDGKCPDHAGIELKKTDEENYFFRLSKYKEKLQAWIAENTEFLKPKNKSDELKNFIDNIEDISVSRLRKNVPWGTEVPGDEEQTVYIWFSALLNYIFSCGYYENRDNFNEWWNKTVQVCGPDNLKFQAVIFQAILASAEIKQTEKLLVHGTILDKDGRKMSKTAGNVIDPIDQLDKYGLSAVRYYALAGLQVYGNSGWDEEQLVKLYNSHLADNYGNLLARVIHLVNLKNIDVDNGSVDSDIHHIFENKFIEIEKLWDEYEITAAINSLHELLKTANQYITEKQPWSKESIDFDKVLRTLFYTLKKATILYMPVIPDKAKEAMESLRNLNKVILFPKINFVNKN